MKLPNITIPKKLIQPKLILILLFLIIVGLEAYLFYYKVYGNLTAGTDNVSVDSSIVRLDVSNYKAALELLDSQAAFTPQIQVTNNPFK